MTIAKRGLASQVEDAASALEARQTENGLEIVATTKPVQELATAAVPLTDRMQSKLDAELAAGRRAVQRAAESAVLRPPARKTEAEIKAEGTSVPVFRPGDFREYAETLAGPAQTKSKG